jgi:hypothetical protein
MPAALSPEDSLRLNVLLAGRVDAIRIDDGAMTLHALTERGEARVALHPNCRSDQYLLRVREVLGGHALGSPGGYPVYLKRWTRMGQAGLKNLEALLLLGEPEAVVAVAHAQTLTDELARRVWWAQPTMEIARCMLAREEVARGPMGRVLADFLIEHLPFEESADANMETVRLVLAAGLADEAARRELWQRARRQPHLYLGFLEFEPDRMPGDAPLSPMEVSPRLAALAGAGNPYAAVLAGSFSAPGQNFLQAAAEALAKPATHRIAYHLLDLIGGRFAAIAEGGPPLEAEALAARAEDLAGLPPPLRAAAGGLLAALPGLEPELKAARLLAGVSQELAAPVLTRSSAVGPLMRRKLEPVLAPVARALARLRGEAHA